MHLNEIMRLYQKRINHPLDDLKIIISGRLATSANFDFSIDPDTGIWIFCTSHNQTCKHLLILVQILC